MAASSVILSGTKSLDGSIWQMPDHGFNAAQSGWGARCPSVFPPFGCDWRPEAATDRRSTRRISPMIDSCAKARVIAIMALELLVFDGKLHEGRKNWACPFGECRENFDDAKSLLQHVPGCPQFSKDKVYCNSCNEHDCFSFRNQHNHFCGLDDNAASSDKGSPKKNKTMRKLSGLLSWSRPSSRASSRRSVQLDSPQLPSAQHGPFSLMIPTHDLPTRSPKPPSPYTQVSPTQATESAAFNQSLSEMEDNSFREMEGSLNHWELSGESAADNRMLNSGFSGEYSQAQMVTDADLLESPVEDLTMEQRTPDFLMYQTDAPASTYPAAMTQVSHLSATHQGTPSRPSVEHGNQTSWAVMSTPLQQNYPVPSSFVSPDGMSDHGPRGNNNNNISPVSAAPANQTFSAQTFQHPTAPSTPNKSRNGSGHSWLSSNSYSTVASEFSDSPPWHHHGQQSSISSIAPPEPVTLPHYFRPPGLGAIRGSPHSGSAVSLLSIAPTNSQMDDFRCPHCSFHPKGKRENFATYLSKHVTNQHDSVKFPCSDCGKEFSRSDNLKTHQKNSCPKTRPFDHSYQQFWTADNNMEWESADLRGFAAPIRLYQGPKFSREIRSK